MKDQEQFSNMDVQDYGCNLVTMAQQILKVFDLTDLQDDQMSDVVDRGQRSGCLSNKIAVLNYADIGNIILKVIGKPDYECIWIGGYNPDWKKPFHMSSSSMHRWSQANVIILQYEQTGRTSEKFHFGANDYNPNLALKIKKSPVGVRLCQIKKRGT